MGVENPCRAFGVSEAVFVEAAKVSELAHKLDGWRPGRADPHFLT